ncbi:ribosome maturation factor RimM [Georgenia yuyongxinii]|uniref:Ribosome maturation factor RimM n=1 Tax=Georgenia yuyongxinii TaxID=2589797 RepID=A0A552WQY0_9MICO|nr:ribosome maturation factor RimM [Georgenia yuyongxinii]TRW45162.1 ribosome maturation factor RimM [Georgenia yuyongxinii]
MLLTVAIIGGPHGLKGEVRLDLRTDDPQRRLAEGSVLETEPADAGPLTVVRARRSAEATYVIFDEARDRTAAESLRGVRLVVESDEDEDDDDEGWYPHQLVGLRAVHVDGRELGTVADLEHLPAQDVLVITEPDGAEARVPFVAELVPAVDPDAGTVTLDPPRGLFAADPADDDESVADDAEDAGGRP